jgi:hypothetical protein
VIAFICYFMFVQIKEILFVKKALFPFTIYVKVNKTHKSKIQNYKISKVKFQIIYFLYFLNLVLPNTRELFMLPIKNFLLGHEMYSRSGKKKPMLK